MDKTMGKTGKAPIKKMRRRGRRMQYGPYIQKMARAAFPRKSGTGQRQPYATLKSESLRVVDDMMTDLVERVMRGAHEMRGVRKCGTLSVRDIHAALKLTLPTDIAVRAYSAGVRAVEQLKNTRASKA